MAPALGGRKIALLHVCQTALGSRDASNVEMQLSLTSLDKQG
jgi:hypothetical protein